MSAKPKKKEGDMDRNLRVIRIEASSELKDYAIDSAKDGLSRYLNGTTSEFYHVCKEIKEAMQSKYPGCWHVIMGKSFGSFVSFEARSLVYIFFGEFGFLIFKHG
eukprot:g572.t1